MATPESFWKENLKLIPQDQLAAGLDSLTALIGLHYMDQGIFSLWKEGLDDSEMVNLIDRLVMPGHKYVEVYDPTLQTLIDNLRLVKEMIAGVYPANNTFESLQDLNPAKTDGAGLIAYLLDTPKASWPDLFMAYCALCVTRSGANPAEAFTDPEFAPNLTVDNLYEHGLLVQPQTRVPVLQANLNGPSRDFSNIPGDVLFALAVGAGLLDVVETQRAFNIAGL
jgi:hypothetical protein